MALGTIWVFAEIADGKPAPVALELLTKARSLASVVEAVAFAPGTRPGRYTILERLALSDSEINDRVEDYARAISG